MNTELHTLYVELVQKMRDVEDALIAHLPKVAEHVTSDELRAAILSHLDETKKQKERLLMVRKEDVSGEGVMMAESFRMMLEESEKRASTIGDPDVRDAFIISAAQTVEQFEIAKYGTLLAWAKQMEHSADADLLKDSLAEEEAALKKLQGLAASGLFTKGINEKAAEEVVRA